MTRFGRIFAVLVIGLVFCSQAIAQSENQVPAYVGSEACADCHEQEMHAWRRSHHALAWTEPTDATVLGDFSGAVFEHNGSTTAFDRDGEDFVIETEGPDGASERFRVIGVVGIAPLQQYLLETEPGRLQVPDTAWDALSNRWYDLYPEAELPPGDGLHWTGPYKNWNARCAECHATGFAKNYDPGQRIYASTQVEIGVGCEACHGPGEEHLVWARGSAGSDTPDRAGPADRGFALQLPAERAQAEIEQCAGCHARREAFGDGNPLPGTAFHDAYRLSLLSEGLYHADGTIEDEVYVYGSFLQSKMYARGVRCTDCHDAHSAVLKAEGNPLCVQCHSLSGNDRFPTLKRANYDDPVHFFHEPGTDGAQCKSCHMPERLYMGIDDRSDHSFRIPRPDLSAETGAPDTCTDCHADRDPAWAAAEIARRFPASQHRGPNFSTVFAAARRDPGALATDLIEIARHEGLPAIIRASALDQLRPAADEVIASQTAVFLKDEDPLIREAAIALQRGAGANARVVRLAPALSDPLRSVRIAAARALLGVPSAVFSAARSRALLGVMGEWQKALLLKADFPETQMSLGGVALTLQNYRAAIQAFREVVELDPQMVEAWSMIARLLAATGEIDLARSALDSGLAANPDHQMLRALAVEIE